MDILNLLIDINYIKPSKYFIYNVSLSIFSIILIKYVKNNKYWWKYRNNNKNNFYIILNVGFNILIYIFKYHCYSELFLTNI